MFQKYYIAIVEGIFEKKIGTINLPIARKENSIIERCISPMGQESITDYEVINEFDSLSVVKCHPAITIPELAQRMSGKKTVTTRTIERDIAALQAKGILKREGGRKSGKWIVVNI